ncbi:MAG: FAD-dependent oxidoreductase [Coriobacteriia bacterium]|nr:FAD-dependent oxidoreductase [Coriobacteriia bacterium]
MCATNAIHMHAIREGTTRLSAPCRARCPVHIDVPGYLSAIADGRFTDALEIVLERNPLPSVCGRICLRPCEEGCRRCLLDEPVAIAQLKRAAADFGAYPVRKRSFPRPESIAIVGSGPTGLTAAYDLVSWGMHATILESEPLLGGMLRYGIPSFRLPDYALDRDIDHILSLGAEAKTRVRVGRDVTVSELAEENDAVLVAVGLPLSRTPPIPGAELPGVMSALPLLAAISRGERVEVGSRVVVVGGGNAAIDVARTVRRLGATKVHLVYRRTRQEMPASEQEVKEAEREGVTLHCSLGPVSIVGDDRVRALIAARCTSIPGEGRRAEPTIDEEQVTRFEADTIVFAIGQAADVTDLALPLTPRGALEVDPLALRSPAEKVYVAGDVISGATTVIDAIAAGHRVAALIYRDLTGDARPLEQLDEESAVLGKVPDAMASKLETRRRIMMERLEYFESVQSFEEIESGYTEYEAAREAQRCLSCTSGARLTREKCASCLTCMRVCPHGVPMLQLGGYLYFDADTCHACGACASQCPAQAIALEGHSEDEMIQRVQRQLTNTSLETTLMFACGSTPILPNIAPGDTRTLTVTCLLRASERTVLRALQEGATRVVFAGCVESTCRFPHARKFVRQRAARITALLEALGMTDAFFLAEYDDALDWHLP